MRSAACGRPVPEVIDAGDGSEPPTVGRALEAPRVGVGGWSRARSRAGLPRPGSSCRHRSGAQSGRSTRTVQPVTSAAISRVAPFVEPGTAYTSTSTGVPASDARASKTRAPRPGRPDRIAVFAGRARAGPGRQCRLGRRHERVRGRLGSVAGAGLAHQGDQGVGVLGIAEPGQGSGTLLGPVLDAVGRRRGLARDRAGGRARREGPRTRGLGRGLGVGSAVGRGVYGDDGHDDGSHGGHRAQHRTGRRPPASGSTGQGDRLVAGARAGLAVCAGGGRGTDRRGDLAGADLGRRRGDRARRARATAGRSSSACGRRPGAGRRASATGRTDGRRWPTRPRGRARRR